MWKEYYENGQLKLKEGHGDQYVYEAYYKSGQLKAIKEYVKVNRKILLRELRTYYEDGDLKSTKKYSLLSDSNKASWEAYHSNGQLKEEGKYKYGDKHGKWSYYDQNGNLIKEERL